MADNNSGRNIWDVIFSLESHHFPIQRNYLREPRGSLNPINSQDQSPVCQKTVDEIKEKVKDPNDLFALDFELNYIIRKLADFILYANLREVSSHEDNDYVIQDDFVEPIKVLSDKYNLEAIDGLYSLDGALVWDFSNLPHYREKILKGWYPRYPSHENGLLDYARYLKALEHIIETSTWVSKTKAEAFLRASSIRKYSPADDETIIYLMHQKLNDPELEKEAQYRWKRYQKEWKDLFFTDKNPFDDKFNVDRLRFIHWDSLSKLRLLEGQLPDEQRNTYEYNTEDQHLLSPLFLNDFTKAFSLFRTDLNVDPIRTQVENLVSHFYSYISGRRSFEYNYTMVDIQYLSDLLFSFASSRNPHMNISAEKETFHHRARNAIEINFRDSTADFLQKIPMVTLIALEVHTVYYSQPRGYLDFLRKAKDWLLNQQTPYGYWYDGVISPEYTTVLVLDALNLIAGNDGLSFPLKVNIVLPSKEMGRTYKPILFVNDVSRTLMLGRETFTFKFRGGENKTWDFVLKLIDYRNEKLPMPIKSGGHDWKHQYDTLARMFRDRDIIKHFITSTGDTYELQNNVHVHSHSQVWAKPGRAFDLDIPFDHRKPRDRRS